MSIIFIIILVIVIIAASFITALSKAVGAGAKVQDFFPEKKKMDEGKVDKEESNVNTEQP